MKTERPKRGKAENKIGAEQGKPERGGGRWTIAGERWPVSKGRETTVLRLIPSSRGAKGHIDHSQNRQSESETPA